MFVFTDINTRLAPARVTSCYDSPPLLSSPLLSWAGVLECWSVVPHINTTTPDCRVQSADQAINYRLALNFYRLFQVCPLSLSTAQISLRERRRRTVETSWCELSDDGKTQERLWTPPRPTLQLRWSGGWRRWRTVSGVGQVCLCCWQPWSSWQEHLEQVSSDFFTVGGSWGVNVGL